MGKYVHHVEARYPSDVNALVFDHSYTKYQCTRFIVGVAQWPASEKQGAPYLFDRYYTEMKRIAHDAAIFADKADDDVKVYLRSIHLNPIKDKTGVCPVIDWRSPVVMDGYTHIIQKAVKEVNRNESISGGKHVEFLDTRFIVSPMWDNAFDWVHFAPKINNVEALFMAAVLYENILN